MTTKKTQETAQPVEQPVNNDCFIIMPIAENDGYNQGHFKRVYEDIFAPACRAAGYRPVRADDVAQTNLIQLDILQKLLESPMAICDLSTRNPNVLFELGLRQAFDKPTILVQEDGTPAIFDISMFRYTTYSKTLDYRQVLADQERIKCVLEETRNAVGDGKSINSIVKLLSMTEAKLEDSSKFSDKDYFQILMSEIKGLKNAISTVSVNRGLDKADKNTYSKYYMAKDTIDNKRSYYKLKVYISLESVASDVNSFINDVNKSSTINNVNIEYDGDEKLYISVSHDDSKTLFLIESEIKELANKNNVEIISTRQTLVIS